MAVLGSTIPNSPCGLCARKATLNLDRNERKTFSAKAEAHHKRHCNAFGSRHRQLGLPVERPAPEVLHHLGKAEEPVCAAEISLPSLGYLEMADLVFVSGTEQDRRTVKFKLKVNQSINHLLWVS